MKTCRAHSLRQRVPVDATGGLHGRGAGTYRMAADCRNCGQPVVVTITRGTPTWKVAPECPTCGCRREWGWQGIVGGDDA